MNFIDDIFVLFHSLGVAPKQILRYAAFAYAAFHSHSFILSSPSHISPHLPFLFAAAFITRDIDDMPLRRERAYFHWR